MAFSIVICLAAFAWLVWMLRHDKVSLGLPVAYLFGLLLIHVPGAFAHLVGGGFLYYSQFTELGIGFAAIGAVCFVAGVWVALRWSTEMPVYRTADRRRFWLFCLAGGWFFTYGLSFLGRIPTLGAAIEKGGAVWMLGILLGLRAAMRRGDPRWTLFWLASLAVYPVLMLLLGGFLSYGAAATTIVLSVLAVSTRSHLRVAGGMVVATVLGFNLFLAYMQHRPAIRDAVWGRAPMEERIDASMNIVRDLKWFDPADAAHLNAIDQRLNQNYFAGLAATRIKEGEVDYLYGRSLWEGLLALVPRAVWPEKPVFAGSGDIVANMTGLVLSESTSWGVGNVMEFQINFGIPGLVAGFLALGWLLGTLDRKAAVAEAGGDLGQVFFYFLPAAALIQPNGSMVELASGSAAAVVAAYGWRWAWGEWAGRRARHARMPDRFAGRRVTRHI